MREGGYYDTLNPKFEVTPRQNETEQEEVLYLKNEQAETHSVAVVP